METDVVMKALGWNGDDKGWGRGVPGPAREFERFADSYLASDQGQMDMERFILERCEFLHINKDGSVALPGKEQEYECFDKREQAVIHLGRLVQ